MKRFLTFSNLRLVVEVVLIMSLLMVAFPKNLNTSAASSEAPEIPNATYWYVCNAPNHIGLFM